MEVLFLYSLFLFVLDPDHLCLLVICLFENGVKRNESDFTMEGNNGVCGVAGCLLGCITKWLVGWFVGHWSDGNDILN